MSHPEGCMDSLASQPFISSVRLFDTSTPYQPSIPSAMGFLTNFFLRFTFVFMFFLHVHQVRSAPWRSEEGAGFPVVGVTEGLWVALWVLGSQTGSSTRVASAFRHRAISPALVTMILMPPSCPLPQIPILTATFPLTICTNAISNPSLHHQLLAPGSLILVFFVEWIQVRHTEHNVEDTAY